MSTNTKKLAGKVAIVTGASKRIGAAIAKGLAADGAAIALQRARDLDLALVMELAALGGRTHDKGQVLDRAGREGETVGRRRQPRGVGHRRALDGDPTRGVT